MIQDTPTTPPVLASTPKPRLRLSDIVCAVFIGIVYICHAELLVRVAPVFKEMFSSFGAKLPALTICILNISDRAALIPFQAREIALLAAVGNFFLFWKGTKTVRPFALLAFLGVAALLVVEAVMLYLPFFQLSKATGN